MLTTTALVLLTVTATVQPVSPTVTPTYTAHEKIVYVSGYNEGIQRQHCLTICSMVELQKEYRRDRLKTTRKKSNNPEDSVGDDMIVKEIDRVEDKLFGDDRYGSKKSIRASEKRAKKKGCDCQGQDKSTQETK